MKKYDYIILGSGPVAIHLLAKLERTTNKVLLIEKAYGVVLAQIRDANLKFLWKVQFALF